MKGIYVLVIKVDKPCAIKVGSLGIIKFDKGFYAYVGSAQNSIESRVKRHLSNNKKLYWHIDYLLANRHVQITRVYYKLGNKSEECKLARMLVKRSTPIKGFGSSDCNCISHLFYISQENLNDLLDDLGLYSYDTSFLYNK